jgi:hypothetical protein
MTTDLKKFFKGFGGNANRGRRQSVEDGPELIIVYFSTHRGLIVYLLTKFRVMGATGTGKSSVSTLYDLRNGYLHFTVDQCND